VKVIGRLPGERSCLSLVWAVLARGGRGVDMNAANVRQLQRIRCELLESTTVDVPHPSLPNLTLADEVTPAA
jgi:putative transposase